MRRSKDTLYYASGRRRRNGRIKKNKIKYLILKRAYIVISMGTITEHGCNSG